jgi:Skp family chaperone for outer membrane proteins
MLAVVGAVAAGAVNWDRLNQHAASQAIHVDAPLRSELQDVKGDLEQMLQDVKRDLEQMQRLICSLIQEHEIRSGDCPATLDNRTSGTE